jgi:hypothetical protein
MPPCAVCTITGTPLPDSRSRARFGQHRLVAELAHHVIEQAPLHRIVVDDENTRGHDHSRTRIVPFRGTLRRLA